jgi:hypothetical protein
MYLKPRRSSSWGGARQISTPLAHQLTFGPPGGSVELGVVRYVLVRRCYVNFAAHWRSRSRLQAMLFAQLADDKEEASAKKSLAVLTELYRRNVWTDARTVNVIASACFHTSHGLLIAALKFFLGQDEKSEQVGNYDRFVLRNFHHRCVCVRV